MSKTRFTTLVSTFCFVFVSIEMCNLIPHADQQRLRQVGGRRHDLSPAMRVPVGASDGLVDFALGARHRDETEATAAARS